MLTVAAAAFFYSRGCAFLLLPHQILLSPIVAITEPNALPQSSFSSRLLVYRASLRLCRGLLLLVSHLWMLLLHADLRHGFCRLSLPVGRPPKNYGIIMRGVSEYLGI
ncbi:hypothetical protein AHAS_Ahas09G0037200 [Arachis hypogaea]